MIEAKCKTCGSSFERNKRQGGKKYCSPGCRPGYVKEVHTTETRQCKVCGSDFEWSTLIPNKKYCSPECCLQSTQRRKTGVKTEARKCKECGCDFEWSSAAPNKKYCSSECLDKATKAKVITETRKCKGCGSDFEWSSSFPSKKYCSQECWAANHTPKPKTVEPKPEILRNYGQRSSIYDKHYVYGWYDGDLLFYVGKGIGDRFKIRHTLNDGSDAYCEKVKRRSKKFKCVILRTGLSDRESRIVESTLIRTCKPFANVSGK